jgi:hypothetical protein
MQDVGAAIAAAHVADLEQHHRIQGKQGTDFVFLRSMENVVCPK